jgi:hypothetical protein
MKRSSCLLLLCAVTLLAACGGVEATEEGAEGASADGGTLVTPPPAPLPPPTGPRSLTVSGTVVSAARQPISGLAVLIAGKAPVNTDAAGRFSFTDVTPPYDLTIVDAANKEAAVYRQLHRADPTLVLFTPAGTVHTAQLQGGISGGHYPQASDEFTVVAFLAPDTFAQSATDAYGGFVMSGPALQWYGPSALSGTLHALQMRYVPSTGLPSAFTGYASKPLTVADGSISVGQDLALLPITSSNVSGTVTAPAGYALQGKGVGTTLDGALALYFEDASTSAGFSYVVPVVPGGQALVSATVSKPGGGTTFYARRGLAPGASGVQLAPYAPPEAILPADGATRVDSQMRFSWTPFTRGIHLVMFEPVSAGAPRITVVTAETSASIPDLSALGLALPRSTQYTWHVEGVGPLADVDAAASLSLLDAWTFAPSVQELQSASSAERTFVSAP